MWGCLEWPLTDEIPLWGRNTDLEAFFPEKSVGLAISAGLKVEKKRGQMVELKRHI